MPHTTKTILKSALVLMVSIGVFAFSIYSSQANLSIRPVDGGPGDSKTKAKVACVTKRVDEYSNSIVISYVIGTVGHRFYIEGRPVSLYARDTSFNSQIIQPSLKLDPVSSGTNALLFQYSGKIGDGLSRSSYFTDFDAEMVIVNVGSIQTLSSDGKRYYDVDFSNLNNPNLPECSIPPSRGFIGVAGSDGCTANCTRRTTVGCYNYFGDYVCSESNNGSGDPTSGGNGGSSASCTDWGPTALELGTCSDGIKNSNETDVDAGGRCSSGMLGGVGPGSKEAFFGHWPSPTRPVRITIEDNLSPIYSQFLPRAIRDWNQAAPIVLTKDGNDSIRVPITNCDYGQTDWVGVTVVNLNGNKIVSAPVYISDFWMKQPFYNNDVQRQYVVTHELGHAFGLDHQDTDFCNSNMGSVMDYTYSILGGTQLCDGQSVNFGISNEHPNPNDIQGLINAYSSTP